MTDAIPGYIVPVHRSLTTPMLMAGAPRTAALLNGTVTAAVGLGMHCLWVVPIGLALHLLAAALARRDPHCFDVLLVHLRQKHYYAA